MRVGDLIREFLAEGCGVRLRVQGTSMLPTILPGSLIEVRPVGTAPLERGEIVLCDVAGRLLGHRVVGVWQDQSGQKVVVRGDNRRACDRTIDVAAVLGRITKVEDGWQWALSYVSRWLVADGSHLEPAECTKVNVASR